MAPQMTPQILADYIKSQFQRGISESQIKDYLLTEKITQAEIDEALKIVKGPSTVQPQPAPLQPAAPAQPSSQFGAFQQSSMVKPAMPQQPIAPKPSMMQTSDISKPNIPQQPSGSSVSQPQILNTLNTMAAGKTSDQQGQSMGIGNTLGAINIPDSGNIAAKKTSKMFYAILAIVLVLMIGGGAFAYFKFINVSAPVVEVPSQQTAAPAPAAPVQQGLATTTQIAASSTTAASSTIATSTLIKVASSTQLKATSTKITSTKATSTTSSVSVPKSAATSTLP